MAPVAAPAATPMSAPLPPPAMPPIRAPVQLLQPFCGRGLPLGLAFGFGDTGHDGVGGTSHRNTDDFQLNQIAALHLSGLLHFHSLQRRVGALWNDHGSADHDRIVETGSILGAGFGCIHIDVIDRAHAQ